MKTCKRVLHYDAPGYPTRDALQNHPELLQCVPERWRRNRFVLAVLSIAVPSLLARHAQAGATKPAKGDCVRIAPIFVHGDGRGAFGCVVVNPPVFLSEDEARQVVQDEAKKAGIEFAPDALVLKDVRVPVTDQYGFVEEREPREKGQNPKPKTQQRDLKLDGYDKSRKIAYETVSMEDFADWEKKDRMGWCSVSSYDFKGTAETLTNGVSHAKGNTVVGVFYEPGASAPETVRPERKLTGEEWKTHWKAREKAAKELGEEELRRQVQDFVAWLKAQGVI